VSKPIALSALLGSLLVGVQEAKRIADLETGRLLAIYEKEQLLSQSTVPAFNIADLEVELRFAIVGAAGDGAQDIQVVATTEDLKGIDPGQVQTIRFKLTPIALRAVEQ
jgi:hypothetical protein